MNMPQCHLRAIFQQVVMETSTQDWLHNNHSSPITNYNGQIVALINSLKEEQET